MSNANKRKTFVKETYYSEQFCKILDSLDIPHMASEEMIFE